MPATAALPLVVRFALILAGLRHIVAASIFRHPTKAALIVLAHTRLSRMVDRLASLVARLQAGRLRPQAPPHRISRSTAPRTGTSPRLPRGFGWLLGLGSWPAAASRSQVQHLLADPEMQLLLRAAPQAGRILRPLCHALGIRPLPEPLRIQPRAAAPSGPSEQLPPPPGDPDPGRPEPGNPDPGRPEPGLPRRRVRDP